MPLPLPGKPFGPYLVDASVGQGGMGAVYRARDARLGRAVALKVMRASESADPEARARFVREARLAAALEHPGIVRVYEVGEIDGTPYIAMEWVDGQTLRAAKVADPNAVLERIAETLAFAHARGVIHRDLKPANVIIDAHGVPKLVDFGIAKRVEPSATFATQDGMVLGTPQYMAPEQMLSSSVDARADQYAWGVIAYELLTGDRPGRPALAHAALDDHRGPIVMRALSVFASDRFASMDALLEAWRRRPVLPVPAPAPIAVPAPRPRVRVSLFVGAAALTIVFASLGLAVLHRREPKRNPNSNVEQAAPSASASVSVIATVSSTSEPSASASKADPAPVSARVARGADIAVGSEHVYREDAKSFKAVVEKSYQKCVAGIPLRGKRPVIRILYYVVQPPKPGYAAIDAYGEKNWPAPATIACLENETVAVDVRPMPETSAGLLYIDVYPR